MNKNREVYISHDVEANGPIPGPYSMTSFAAVVAGYKENRIYYPTDMDNPKNQYYSELKPITQNYKLDALKVGVYDGLTREEVDADTTGTTIMNYLNENGKTPEEALTEYVEWVQSVADEHQTRRIVFAGYPLGFDWTFMYWYLANYDIRSPYGFSRHLDIKTLYSAKSNALITNSIKSRMPKSLLSKRKHTHHALDDAIEQGEMLMLILEC